MSGVRIRVVLVVTTLLTSARCSSHYAELRLENIGLAPVENVVVLFPKGEARFGVVPGRSTTAYATVKYGVGTYRVQLEPGVSQPFLRVVEVVKDR